MNRRNSSRVKRTVWMLSGLLLAAMVGGCNFMSWFGQGVLGGGRTVLVTAAYRGLEQQRVAVLVSSSGQIESKFPLAVNKVGQVVCGAVMRDVPGAVVMSSDKAAAFTQAHPGWQLTPTGALMKQLKVDRLVSIDLHEYRTHEPGNTNIWRGVIQATVDVAEADGADPHRPVFRQEVMTRYPPDGIVGMLSSSSQAIEQQMLPVFALQVAHLFVDHEETH